MRKAVLLMLAISFLLFSSVSSADEDYPPQAYTEKGKAIFTYESDHLRVRTTRFTLYNATAYLTQIWMSDPGRQIRKATAQWETDLEKPAELAEQIPEAIVITNGSGFISPKYPWIPDNYPGESEDYFYTPLGSLTVTDGSVFRNLTGVSYTGLTLEEDGLHMYVGTDPDAVLDNEPMQTWSFYDECPVMLRNEEILPEEWRFADQHAERTVIARVNRNNYILLHVTDAGGPGWTLRQVAEFLKKRYDTEWVYNLDGGPSSTLIIRKNGSKKGTTLTGGTVRVTDIMAFTDLPSE